MRLDPPRCGRYLVSAIAALALGGAAAGLVEAAGADALPRVRSSHAYIRAMIDEASQRSATFRMLVSAIEATDGIVYVEQGDCGHRVRACLTFAIAPAGEYRILRVLVDARQPDWDVMSSIGHELRHALEVLSEARIKTTEGIYLYYAREHATMGETFETGAAVRTGNTVHDEVANYAKRR